MAKKLTKKEIEAIKKSHALESDVCTEEESQELKKTLKKIEEDSLSKSEDDEF